MTSNQATPSHTHLRLKKCSSCFTSRRMLAGQVIIKSIGLHYEAALPSPPRNAA